jgi:acyl-CoA dehydrogenase
MNRAWPKEALDFEAVVADAFGALGGVDAARHAELAPEVRQAKVAPLLAGLGIAELDVGDPLEAAVAARVVRAAGSVVFPWPLVQVLAVPPAMRDLVDAVYLGDTDVSRLEHLDLVRAPAVLSLRAGTASRVQASGPIERMPLDPFGVPTELSDTLNADLRSTGLAHLLLTGFWILGALSRIVDLSVGYAATRKQFDRRIADFGAIQWRLADSAVARDGLEELATYTLWLAATGQARVADHLALRLAALEAARAILTHAHQIFASIGLCEEHDLAVMDRHLQASIRRPFGEAATAQLLADRIGNDGFDGLFVIPARERASDDAVLTPA